MSVKYAISACLMGVKCRYDGKSSANEELIEFMKDKEYILICPEVLGGLSTPRKPCEITCGKVINCDGEDMSEYFIKGSNQAIEQIRDNQIELIILKSKSPSCGKGLIYDGTFSGKLIEGDGLFVRSAQTNGYKCISDIDFASKYLDKTRK